ncbi:integrase [Enterobacter roggenkampii]|uniref:integrase n=1 Tax=Enterobacter roggenkampii TaxID=1812935 RepID=UPI002003816A|nr:integrase [Enterobacter roggenkampii]MCK7070244.1 integrase [Enterobacter roggenkampii]MCK7093586.1 integrase [Enterobacter roggenkampii]
MHRIDTPTAQKDKFGAGKNGFTRGNPQTGTPATDLDDDYFDMLQEELAGVVEATGVVLDKSKHNQLLTALKSLLLSREHPFADIKADGAAAIATALSNLGLGAGAPAIGIPFFWPSSAMPNTVMTEWADMVFQKFNGATFSAATYPKLALVFPGLVLTEARGEFLRIWDDGRGVDAGRGLLSAQGHAYQSHSHRLLMSAGSAGSGNVIGIDGSLNGTFTYSINQPDGGQIQAIENAGGTETRPRNIAFNFLVRAK